MEHTCSILDTFKGINRDIIHTNIKKKFIQILPTKILVIITNCNIKIKI
jgi:hypothetical protein